MTTSTRTGRARRSRALSARQHLALWAVSEGRIHRGLTCGRLEPYLLDGRDVAWPLRGLVVRGLVMLYPLGPPILSARGRALLDDLSGPVSTGRPR